MAVAPHGSREGASVLRVLAFGDSLTEGFHCGGSRFHPYALRLKALLQGSAPPGTRIVIDERGCSGEFVVPTMRDRLLHALRVAGEEGEPYDWVCLLGGTNDIGCDAPASEVLEALADMHQAVAEHGAQLVAMTLPPFNMRLSPRQQREFDTLNAALRQRWGGSGGGGGGDSDSGRGAANVGADGGGAPGELGVGCGSILVDLEPLFPTMGSDAAAGRLLWDDWVHLTPAGYDRMADAVFEAMRPHLGYSGERPAPGAAAAGWHEAREG